MKLGPFGAGGQKNISTSGLKGQKNIFLNCFTSVLGFQKEVFRRKKTFLSCFPVFVFENRETESGRSQNYLWPILDFCGEDHKDTRLLS